MPTPVSMHIFIVDVSLKAYKPCHDIKLLHTKPFYENHISYIYCENNKNSWPFLCFSADPRFSESL